MRFKQTMSEEERMRKWNANEIFLWQALSTKERLGVVGVLVVFMLWGFLGWWLFH